MFTYFSPQTSISEKLICVHVCAIYISCQIDYLEEKTQSSTYGKNFNIWKFKYIGRGKIRNLKDSNSFFTGDVQIEKPAIEQKAELVKSFHLK